MKKYIYLLIKFVKMRKNGENGVKLWGGEGKCWKIILRMRMFYMMMQVVDIVYNERSNIES